MTQELAQSKECSGGVTNLPVTLTVRHQCRCRMGGDLERLMRGGTMSWCSLWQCALQYHPNLQTTPPTSARYQLACWTFLFCFVFRTVMFRLQNKKCGMKTSLGNLRAPYATQNPLHRAKGSDLCAFRSWHLFLEAIVTESWLSGTGLTCFLLKAADCSFWKALEEYTLLAVLRRCYQLWEFKWIRLNFHLSVMLHNAIRIRV